LLQKLQRLILGAKQVVCADFGVKPGSFDHLQHLLFETAKDDTDTILAQALQQMPDYFLARASSWLMPSPRSGPTGPWDVWRPLENGVLEVRHVRKIQGAIETHGNDVFAGIKVMQLRVAQRAIGMAPEYGHAWPHRAVKIKHDRKACADQDAVSRCGANPSVATKVTVAAMPS